MNLLNACFDCPEPLQVVIPGLMLGLVIACVGALLRRFAYVALRAAGTACFIVAFVVYVLGSARIWRFGVAWNRDVYSVHRLGDLALLLSWYVATATLVVAIGRIRGRRKQPPAPPAEPAPILLCSFCNKSQREVRTLIAGPKVQICNECIDICLAVLHEKAKDREFEAKDGWLKPVGPSWPVGPRGLLCSFCRMPTALEHAVMVPDRGILCLGCIGEIEAAVAVSRGNGRPE